MIGMLAHRTLGDRPRRTAMLLLGLGIAVGVMITLLSIGQAVLLQAEDKDLVGGGDVLLLPAGIDIEVMKIGGATGMYATLDNARFLYRQVLSGPRFAASIARVQPEYASLPLAAASPALVDRIVYVRKSSAKASTAAREDGLATPAAEPAAAAGRGTGPGTAPFKALAHGFIPSLDGAAGGPTAKFASQGIEWHDHAADRMWVDPPIDSLYNDMDRFHLPARTLPGLDHWAEWLYFNFRDDDTGAFGYVSFMVGGDIEAGKGRGGPLLKIQRPGEPPLEFSTEVPVQPDDVSLTRVDLRLGSAATAQFRDGAYRLRLAWDAARGPVRADLVVRPVLDLYYPPVLIHDSESFVSGYTVPALRAAVSGTIRAPGVALTLRDVPGYHDHNWGTWRSVSWEWGTASTERHAILYGRVQHPDIDPGRSGAGIFVLLAEARSDNQRGGALGLFRPPDIRYDWQDTPALPGDPERVPRRLSMSTRPWRGETSPTALQGPASDAIDVTFAVRTRAASPPRTGEDLVFLQLQGLYTVQAQLGAGELHFATPGFAEVFVPPHAAVPAR